MSLKTDTIPEEKRIEIRRIVTQCKSLCDDVDMIFFFSAYKYVSNYRYTYVNPATILKFLVVTKTKEGADKLQMDWIIESTKENDRNAYTANLLILSEDEFIAEYDMQAPFRKMLESVIVVYGA